VLFNGSLSSCRCITALYKDAVNAMMLICASDVVKILHHDLCMPICDILCGIRKLIKEHLELRWLLLAVQQLYKKIDRRRRTPSKAATSPARVDKMAAEMIAAAIQAQSAISRLMVSFAGHSHCTELSSDGQRRRSSPLSTWSTWLAYLPCFSSRGPVQTCRVVVIVNVS